MDNSLQVKIVPFTNVAKLKASVTLASHWNTAAFTFILWTHVLNSHLHVFFRHVGIYRGADKFLARPDWKNNWKVAIFRPTRSLLPQRPGWMDKLLNFFWVACKSWSLIAVAYFLPGRAKDLSAPRYNCVLSHMYWTHYLRHS